MKKIGIYFLSFVFVTASLIACGGGGDDDIEPTPTPTNRAPSVPTLSTPANNLVCVDNVVIFQWNNSTDPDGDAISYKIEVAKDNGFTQIEHSLTSVSPSQSMSLEKGKNYFWRVKATDSKNLASEWSTTFKLQTEALGVVNHAPFVPALFAPTMNSTLQTTSTTLSWETTDSDSGDVLTYDVYFGTEVNPVAKISSNQTEKTLALDFQASKTYYWKVIAKDNKGAQTQSQVWSFKTN